MEILFSSCYFISITQFCVPNVLDTRQVQLGSSIHFPSTKNLYSCLPGFNSAHAVQLPFGSFRTYPYATPFFFVAWFFPCHGTTDARVAVLGCRSRALRCTAPHGGFGAVHSGRASSGSMKAQRRTGACGSDSQCIDGE